MLEIPIIGTLDVLLDTHLRWSRQLSHDHLHYSCLSTSWLGCQRRPLATWLASSRHLTHFSFRHLRLSVFPPSLFIAGTWNSLWQWLFMKGWREKERQLQHMVTWWLCRGCENINLPSLLSCPVFCAANLCLPNVTSCLIWFESRDTTLVYKYMKSTIVHHLIAHGIYSYYVKCLILGSWMVLDTRRKL